MWLNKMSLNTRDFFSIFLKALYIWTQNLFLHVTLSSLQTYYTHHSKRILRKWKYFSWQYSHSCLKVKYSVRCLHSWLPLRRNNVLGYRIFRTHKYKTHCKRKCFQWISLTFLFNVVVWSLLLLLQFYYLYNLYYSLLSFSLYTKI